MENFIVDVMNSYGYIGISILIMIENLFPPIPSEIILTFGGFMTCTTNLNVIGVIIASTIGSLLGALILYFLGRLLNKSVLIKIVNSKYGKIIRIKPDDINKADHWFDTKGYKTVFFCRFIPVVRSLISIPAGMSEMPIIKFIIYTLGGSVIWNITLVLIGTYAGEKRELFIKIIEEFSLIIIIILLIGLLLLFIKIIKRNKGERYEK